MKVSLDYTKTLEENAGIYFDKAKKAKKKLEGLQEAIAKTEERLSKARKEHTQAEEHAEMEGKMAAIKKEWYEKFRWFYTSAGHLVIGGRDAQTNEIIIKKHTEEGDIVFHTDMAGSPFFIIKAGGEDVTEEELKEVAQATAAYSKAWTKGLSSTDVFWVRPDQVTKEAQAGEYLSTGSFMIRGKTNYIRFDEMAVAVGRKDLKVIGGPVSAVAKQTQYWTKIRQGDEKPGKIAKQVRKQIGGGDLDDIIRFLPAGGVRMAKK
jgi:predicted ribosome quality control (RQC) complex YloA/Tae2 family protein